MMPPESKDSKYAFFLLAFLDFLKNSGPEFTPCPQNQQKISLDFWDGMKDVVTFLNCSY